MQTDLLYPKRVLNFAGSGERSNLVLLTVVVGLIISLSLFISIRSWEQKQLDKQLNDIAQQYNYIVSTSLQEYIHELEIIATFYKSSNTIHYDDFKTFTSKVARSSSIQAIEWVPRVAYKDKIKHEQLIQQEGFPGYSIREKSSSEKFNNVSQRSDYYPAAFINPMQGNSKLHGLDLASNNEYHLEMQQAIRSGKPVASKTIALLQSGKKRNVILIFYPYFGKQSSKNKIESFFVAALYIDTIVEEALKLVKSSGLNIYYTDITDPLDSQPLYFHLSRSIKDNKTKQKVSSIRRKKISATYLSKIEHESIVEFAGRKWAIKYQPVDKFYQEHTRWFALFVLALGILFTIFAATVINTLHRKKLAAEKLSKLRSEQLVNIETAQRAVQDTMADGLIVINDEGIIESFNQTASKMFGYSYNEIVGESVNKLMPRNISVNHDNYLKHSVPTTRIQNIESRRDIFGVHKDGSQFPIALSIKGMTVDGKIKYTGILRDITEQVNTQNDLIEAKEKAEAAAKIKSAFLANMSHEIRTPMNGILGMLQILEDTPLSEEQKQQVEIIDNSAQALLSIINDILDFSKIEAGKFEIIPETCRLQSIVENTLALLKNTASDKGIELTFKIDENCPEYVLADSGRLRQVLLNLAGNAVKFTSKGKVDIHVINLQTNNNKAGIKFEVNDTGIGISKQAQQSLFDAFTQVDNSIQRKFGGTGLGLTISKQLIELMGGEIGVNSTEGKGSTFWFKLELPVSASTAEKSTTVQKDITFNNRILLVEDNIVNEKIMAAILLKLGIDYEHANDGEQAVKKWAEGNFDLILMDCQMPVMDGFEATRIIRENELQKNRKRIPIIALTANVMESDKQQCLDAGMDAHLAKPIDREKLVTTLDYWLNKKSNQVA